jgi:hypothetical protein
LPLEKAIIADKPGCIADSLLEKLAHFYHAL